MNRDTEQEMSRRSQPVPGAELDRRLLERAEKMTEGRKTIGSKAPHAVFSVTNAKEDNTMDRNTHINEVRSRKPAAFAAIAAVLVLAAGGAVYALKYRSSDLEMSPVKSQTTETADKDGDSSPNEGEYYTVNGKKANAWAEPYLAQNSDTIGYIHIPGLEEYDSVECVDAPVVASSDESFYMTHAFDKSTDEAGCIFAKADKGFGDDGSQQQVIQLFGYDNTGEAKARDMTDTFQALLLYDNITVLKQAPIIEFKTIHQDGGEYAIFGLLEVQGDALGIGEVEDVREWADWIRSESYFDVDMDCGADDKYLVLNIHNGQRTTYRVFAKKLDEGDDKDKIISSYREKDSESHGNSALEGRKVSFWLEQYVNGAKMLEDSIDITKDHEISGIFPISMVGDKEKKTELFFIDPISSDSRTGRFCYALYDIDFFKKTITLNGEINKEAAERMLGEGAGAVMMKIPVSDGSTSSLNFDIFIDGEECFYVPMALDGRPGHINFLGMAGTGKKTVTLQTQLDGKTVDYAVYDVDFANGEYTIRNESKLSPEGDKQSMSITVELPEETKDLYFDAYLGDELYSSEYVDEVEHNDDTVPKLNFIINGSGQQNVTIRARNYMTGKELVYAVCEVDFDSGIYKFTEVTPGAEDMLALMSDKV